MTKNKKKTCDKEIKKAGSKTYSEVLRIVEKVQKHIERAEEEKEETLSRLKESGYIL
jgi:hypothetical protein